MEIWIYVAFLVVHANAFVQPKAQLSSSQGEARPPRWNVSFRYSKVGLKKMLEDGIPWKTKQEQTKLRFIYVKAASDGLQPGLLPRKEDIADVVHSPDRLDKDVYFAGSQRLAALLLPCPDHFVSDAIPPNVLSYMSILSWHLPKWLNSELAYVVHEDDSDKWNLPLLHRVQLGGLCYMHAPAVLQSYLVSWNARNSENAPTHQMIDLTRFIVENFNAREAMNHIFDDIGGNSLPFLQRILEPNSKYLEIRDIESISSDMIKRYGPALVHQFEVCEDFQSPECFSFTGQPFGESRGLHAMVLIGIRVDRGKKAFLLQNWWREKQFVEMDSEYLLACRASVVFVKTPQTKIPESFLVQDAIYAETANLDKAESLLPERGHGWR